MEILSLSLDGKAITTSRIVADVFKKTHKHVLENIKNMGCSASFRESNYRLSSYKSKQNKTLGCYEITRDGFVLLGMGFVGDKAMVWKELYLAAFNEMEKALLEPLSFSKEINSAIAILDKDTLKAGTCGKGLAEWKKIKKQHEAKIIELVKKSQLELNFSKD